MRAAIRTIPFAALALLCVAIPGSAWAQAGAGPISGAKSVDPLPPPPKAKPPIEARTSILGSWKYNTDDSDDAHKRIQEAQQSNGSGQRRMGGGFPGIGFPGGGGGYGGGGRQSIQANDNDPAMQEFLYPPKSIALAQNNSEIDLTDDQGRKRAIFTDGRKLVKSKGANYEEIAAHWEGNRLVTDEKSPKGGKMSRTFELSYDGKQLWETLHLNVGHSGSPISIRYVYDAPPAMPQAAPAPAAGSKQ
jgi:hypothetical protein